MATTGSRPVSARARRIAAMVDSVPEFVKRQRGSRKRRVSSSATATASAVAAVDGPGLTQLEGGGHAARQHATGPAGHGLGDARPLVQRRELAPGELADALTIGF